MHDCTSSAAESDAPVSNNSFENLLKCNVNLTSSQFIIML